LSIDYFCSNSKDFWYFWRKLGDTRQQEAIKLVNSPDTGDKKPAKSLKVRLRFDYRGEKNGGLFGRKTSEKVAEEMREHIAALLRNVPRRGISIEEINADLEIYTIYDEESGKEAAFAPLEILVNADRIEDIMGFIVRPEFRRIEVIHPEEIVLSNKGLERLLYKVNEELNEFTRALEKKLNSK
jgi:hypothetical protein